jgi:hypothetical protein
MDDEWPGGEDGDPGKRDEDGESLENGSAVGMHGNAL